MVVDTRVMSGEAEVASMSRLGLRCAASVCPRPSPKKHLGFLPRPRRRKLTLLDARAMTPEEALLALKTVATLRTALFGLLLYAFIRLTVYVWRPLLDRVFVSTSV